MGQVILIECRTGCTCCSDQNHYRGPYASMEDAQRRIAYWNAPDSGYWPLASQYARRGIYQAKAWETEEISGNRFIICDQVVPIRTPIEVKPDGTVDNPEIEVFPNF